MTLRGEEYTLEGERWPVKQENNVWRITPSARFLDLIEGAGVNEGEG